MLMSIYPFLMIHHMQMIKKIHKKDYEGAIKAIKGETEEESE